MVKLHQFNSENEALQAVDIINQGEGIPVNEYAVTKTYCVPFAYADKWYIYKDEVTSKYLHNFVEIEFENDL